MMSNEVLFDGAECRSLPQRVSPWSSVSKASKNMEFSEPPPSSLLQRSISLRSDRIALRGGQYRIAGAPGHERHTHCHWEAGVHSGRADARPPACSWQIEHTISVIGVFSADWPQPDQCVSWWTSQICQDMCFLTCTRTWNTENNVWTDLGLMA